MGMKASHLGSASAAWRASWRQPPGTWANWPRRRSCLRRRPPWRSSVSSERTWRTRRQASRNWRSRRRPPPCPMRACSRTRSTCSSGPARAPRTMCAALLLERLTSWTGFVTARPGCSMRWISVEAEVMALAQQGCSTMFSALRVARCDPRGGARSVATCCASASTSCRQGHPARFSSTSSATPRRRWSSHGTAQWSSGSGFGRSRAATTGIRAQADPRSWRATFQPRRCWSTTCSPPPT